MALDVVNAILPARILPKRNKGGILNQIIDGEPNYPLWLEHPSSSIIHHEQRCCEEAHLWFLSYARSMEIKTTSNCDIKAPTWLSRLFEWGPSEWPISWCQVVKEKTIDCGVFAALAREVFAAQGLDVHPAQALLSYNSTCTGHWQEYWDQHKRKKTSTNKKEDKRDLFPWIGNQVVYHEICVIEQADCSARFYDSTWGHWYLPEARSGFNSLLAVRSECSRLLKWNNRFISCGEWMEL